MTALLLGLYLFGVAAAIVVTFDPDEFVEAIVISFAWPLALVGGVVLGVWGLGSLAYDALRSRQPDGAVADSNGEDEDNDGGP